MESTANEVSVSANPITSFGAPYPVSSEQQADEFDTEFPLGGAVQDPDFEPAVAPATKRGRDGRSKRGGSASRKRKRNVAFDSSENEVRIISPTSTISYPVTQTRSRRRRSKSLVEDDAEVEDVVESPADEISLFGENHLPARDPNLRNLVQLQQKLEELQQYGKALPYTTSSQITFRDTFTGCNMNMLRSELRADILAIIEAAEAANPDETPIIEFEVATPAAVWLYLAYLRAGRVDETLFQGWEEMIKAYPTLAGDSYLNALLAALALAREIGDAEFEKNVVDAIASVARSSLVSG